ncbi:CaCA family Na /Ca antiporter [[Clostridium] sordellii]|uniref:calcium/sodium antiporter n=1 Tax=Paraclostridium sordellii TaxID=1505 RepID=UPI0005E3D549|nr:calcium/sodium antiporter [Paeniclostridium sordellii]MBX9179888.1 calcium/sodium antiporter [Paeniclostridium sordellii]CEO11569.1 CaCA family Na /Ca antiporter [[Clostridium] sordellii] [Paeniclostridium sordellii]
MVYLFLLLGFLFLVKGADYFVDGSSSIAKYFKVPQLIIGLTIVAFGTSAPEAAVSITASIQGQNGIALGNVIGSNIFNLLCVVGMSAFISTLPVKKSILLKEFPFLLLSSIVLFILCNDFVFQKSSISILSSGDGLILLLFFIIFIYYLLGVALKSRKETKIDYDDLVLSKDNSSGNTCACEISLSKALIMSIVGIIGIVLGGKLVVDCASDIAITFGVSEKMIGLTIVSIGTSLPEFVTSVIAASKGESDIALGNVIGSNVFNILFILGLSSLISPIPVDPSLFFDIAIMILITIVTYLFSIRKKDVNKFESIILIAAYAIYMMLVIFKV